MRYASIALLSTTLLASCAQYALTVPNTMQQGNPVIEVSDNIYSVREKLEADLRYRGRVERAINDSSSKLPRIVLIQPWIRDLSLRYYMLEFDTRIRQLTEWKAQWTLEEIAPMRTRIRMKVLEILFMGPPRIAGPRPEITPDGIAGRTSDWFETDEDNLRAAAELRHFFIQNYPLRPLPRTLAQLPITAVESLPNATARLQARWKPFERPRSF